MAFRQLFQPLVHLDCQGEVQPGLATSWHADSSGRTWTFAIRGNGYFPDGTPITAQSIEADWSQRGDALQPAGLESVHAVDDSNLLVTMRDLPDSIPRMFADPLWSILPDHPLSASTGLIIDWPQSEGILELAITPVGDPRDALDAGGDLVISRDPQVLEYAGHRPELETFPLPWDRTYALLQQAGAEPLKGEIRDATVQRSLAQDAVHAEARPAQAQYWWNGACGISAAAGRATPTSGRIVYQQTDSVARQLAERIVVLAGANPPLSATGLDAVRFAAALKDGGDRGYIVGLPIRSPAPCRESAQLTAGRRVYPLIETRARAIVRRGSPALTVDYDGTVRIAATDQIPERPR
jgi:extracellular solute-binding protein (family 5)